MEAKENIRVMPSSIEAEQSVIGAVFVDRDALITVSGILRPEDFHHAVYRHIYEAMLEMNEKGQSIDPVTLQDNLRQKNFPEDMYSFERLRDLSMAVPSSVRVAEYAGIVKEKALLRSLIKTADTIINDCYDQAKATDIILTDAEKELLELLKKRESSTGTTIDQALEEVVDNVNEAYKNKGALTGVPTGFSELDECLNGLQPSDLIVVAARPSMGKTAFVLNIAEHAALKKGVGVAFFSLEMSAVQLATRLLAMESGVNAKKLRNGSLSGDDWEHIVDGVDVLGSANLIIDDAQGMNISKLRSRCRKYKMEENIGLVIIDYIQLMEGSGKRAGESRLSEISEISRGLKMLARELDVPVVALSQLSRAPEQRPDHRPVMSDIRESGSIEQDADVIMFLYRDEYYNKDTDKKNVAEVNVAKHRQGEIKKIELAWIPGQTRFYDLDKQYSQSAESD